MTCVFPHRRLIRVIALLLVATVPSLSTMARKEWDLSPSDHGHYLIDASKAKMSHASVLCDRLFLDAVVGSAPSQSQMYVERSLQPASFRSMYLLGVIISLQHRSPPIPAA